MTNTTNTWSEDQPAVVYVRSLVAKYFPAVAMYHDATLSIQSNTHVRNHPAQGVGGRQVRLTAHGTPSRHSEGRAADIYTDVRNPYLKQFGDELFAGLAAHATVLGLEDLIWDTHIWFWKKPYVHAYTETDHRNHLHVSFSRIASQQRNALLETIIKEAAAVADAGVDAAVADAP